MQQSESQLTLKRQKFKVELRRQELDCLFKKRRQEFEISPIIPLQQGQSQVQEINRLIATLHHQHLYPIMAQVIKMDASLSLLFYVTGIVPENVPAFLAKIIRNICGQRVFPQKIDLQKISQEVQWLHFPKENLTRICQHFDKWSKAEGQTYSRIKGLLTHLVQFNEAASTPFIEFVALVANISLIVAWAEEKLMDGMEEYEARRKHQLITCTSILTNMLAGKEQNIVQHIPLILYSTSNHIKCIGIYFNFFLIEKVDPLIKFQMFRIFTRLLCLNHEEILQQHSQIIATLASCMKYMPILPAQVQQSYLQIGLKLTELLSSLLQMLNLRYQNTQLYLAASSISSDEEDKIFVHHIAVILEKLAEEKYICCALMESKSIVRFVLNHLQPSKHIRSVKTACCLIMLLNQSTYYSFSLQAFSKEILLVHKLMRILTKVDVLVDSNMLSTSLMLVYIQKLLGTLSNCCHLSDIFSYFLQQHLLDNVASLYFKLPRSRKTSVREECLYLYLNMLTSSQSYLSDRDEQRQLVLNLLFGNKKTFNLFIEALKSTQTELIELAVNILCLYVRVEQKSAYNQHLNLFLSNTCLLQQIHLMLQSDKQEVEECALRAKMVLSQRVKQSLKIDEEEECLQ